MNPRMIGSIIATGFRALRRDRVAFILSFVLPIAFFTIFAFVFGKATSATTPRVSVLIVDEDHSPASRALVAGLLRESSLDAATQPAPTKEDPSPVDYTATTAEAAVRSGDAPAALIIPSGFGAHPIAFGPSGAQGTAFQILNDPADPVAAQVLSGMLQKTIMTALPATMASAGTQYFDQEIGGLSPQQRKQMDEGIARLRQLQETQAANPSAPAPTNATGGLVDIHIRNVVGQKKRSPMISYYAAAIGVMFLLFTASATSGSLLDESDSGALDRVLSARVTMTTLLAGKLLYSALLAFLQLVVMFLWATVAFHLDLFTHIPGFLVMTAATSLAVAAFGMLLASLAKTRAQLGAVSTLLILTMSAIGGSMFPRFLMPEAMRKAGLFSFNSWAIDGYTKVFWRDLPVTELGPQVAVLLAATLALFLLARLFARRWDSA
jgi:ABC-2 type transport system permease protein